MSLLGCCHVLNTDVAVESPQDTQRFRLLWALSLVLTGTVLTWLLLRDGAGVLARLAAMSLSAQAIGKWLIFVGAKRDNPYGFNAWELAFLISLLDLWIAIGLNTFLPQLEKLPRIGPWLIKTRIQAATTFHQYPRLERMAFWGVVLWVMLPLPASGAITGSFATRLVGLSRMSATFAILIGSLGNGLVFAAMATALGAHSAALIDNPQFTVISSVLLLGAIWFGWRRLRRLLREG